MRDEVKLVWIDKHTLEKATTYKDIVEAICECNNFTVRQGEEGNYHLFEYGSWSSELGWKRLSTAYANEIDAWKEAVYLALLNLF